MKKRELKLRACPEITLAKDINKLEMGILSDAPQGFGKAVSAINSLPQGVLAEMVRLYCLVGELEGACFQLERIKNKQPFNI